MAVEQSAAGGENGGSLADGEVGERPGGLGGEHVGCTPAGAGHVAKTLDRMHRCDATCRARGLPVRGGTDRGAVEAWRGREPAVLQKTPGQSVGRGRVLAIGSFGC